MVRSKYLATLTDEARQELERRLHDRLSFPPSPCSCRRRRRCGSAAPRCVRVPSTEGDAAAGRSAAVGRCATNAPLSSTSSHSTAGGESSAAWKPAPSASKASTPMVPVRSAGSVGLCIRLRCDGRPRSRPLRAYDDAVTRGAALWRGRAAQRGGRRPRLTPPRMLSRSVGVFEASASTLTRWSRCRVPPSWFPAVDATHANDHDQDRFGVNPAMSGSGWTARPRWRGAGSPPF